MGEWFQTVVDKDATEDEAPRLAAEIHQWLVGEGIVSADPTDCILNSDYGFAPGPHYDKAVGEIDENLQGLLTNGLELVTERTVFDSGQGGSDLVCSKCSARSELSDEWAKTVGEWFSKSGPAQLACPNCGHAESISEWRHDPPWGFANLGFQFWNWPPLEKAFVDEFAKRLQHHVILVAGKV